MDKKAMSLVEVIVSLVVLSIAALGVAATVGLLHSKAMRSAGGSSLDLQATGYARETLEKLKNAVSTEVGAGETGEMLVGSTAGVVYTPDGNPDSYGNVSNKTNPDLVLNDSDLKNHGGKRTYRVEDVDTSIPADGIPDYKRVTVTVTWND